MPPVLSLSDLTISIQMADGRSVPVVRGAELQVGRGEIVGLVGESGSGKSLTALSILDLLPPGVSVESGSVVFEGVELRRLPESRLRDYRGRQISMIFQEPITALNPVLSVGFQLRECIPTAGRSRQQLDEEATRLLSLVGIPAASKRLDDYPHQLSGGQRQRLMIAMALAAEPSLLIADEPTSALDVTIQTQILELLDELRSTLDLSILWISHDLSLVAARCDRVVVMYAGQVVEESPADRLLTSPLHPYSKALSAATPRLGEVARGRLPSIRGRPPEPLDWPSGCAFHPRCQEAVDACRVEEPELRAQGPNRQARCLLVEPEGGSGGTT